MLVAEVEDLGERRPAEVGPLGEYRRRRLAERAPRPFEADRRHPILSGIGPQVQRDEIPAPGVAARHRDVGAGQSSRMARPPGVIHQPGDPRVRRNLARDRVWNDGEPARGERRLEQDAGDEKFELLWEPR